MTAAVAQLRGSSRDDLRVVAAAAAVGVLGASLAVIVGPMAVLVVTSVALAALVAARPVVAAYVYLGLLPFVTGVGRGALIPLLRPNEAVQVGLTAAVLIGVYVRYVRGECFHLRITRLDRAIVALAALSSIWPVAWVLLRGDVPTSTDVLSTVPLWRYAALYALYRSVVLRPEQLRRCLWVLLGGAAVLAVIAALQSSGVLVLPSLWGSDSNESSGRGNATLSSAIAVGDYLACSLALVLAWTLRSAHHKGLMTALGVVLLVGGLGTGQFSAWIGALLVVVLVARHERQLGRLALRALPAGLVGLAVTWPVVGRRLAGFSGDSDVPSSWIGRVDNLTSFYLPELRGFRWVLGVQPNSVLPAPETWREVIFLESGVLWLFWVGGVPLALAFVWFLRAAMRHTRVLARRAEGDVGAVSLATWAGLWVFAVLSIIDMHITLRGAGDLLFIMLGLSAIRFRNVEGSSVEAPGRVDVVGAGR